MKRRYLKTPEEVIALKDTDTKIYQGTCEEFREGCYYKFINGVLCRFNSEKDEWQVDISIWSEDKPYIIEEEPMQDAFEDDIGKLCYFWDDDMPSFRIGKLDGIDKIEKNDEVRYLYKTETNNPYQHCRRITTSEIASMI